MKKWIATYILFVSCIAFSISGRASCGNECVPLKNVKVPVSSKTREFRAQKIFSKQQTKEDGRPDEFGRSLVNAAGPGCPSVVPYLTEERPDLFTHTGTSYSVLVPRAVILKGYLLHLFPSHYFW